MSGNEKNSAFEQGEKDIMLSALSMLRGLHNRKKLILLLQITQAGEDRLVEMKKLGIEPDKEEVLKRVRYILSMGMALVAADGLEEIIGLVGEPTFSVEFDMREPQDIHGESATVH
jgi:hypothetical protein